MKELALLIFVFPLIGGILGGCQSGTQKATIEEDGIIHLNIDISKNYPRELINDDSFRIEYVPLETTNDVLVGMSPRLNYISEKYIVIYESTIGKIYVFDRSGKIISQFNHKGEGPGEYNVIFHLVVDEKNEELFVFDNFINSILVYSLTGEYRRTLKYAADWLLEGAWDYDDETMLVYDIFGLSRDNYNNTPYMLLSKKDGNITSTLIHLPIRYNIHVDHGQQTDASGNSYSTGSTITVYNKRYAGHGNDLVIADVSSDTIYRLTKKGDLKPFIVRMPSVHSTDPRLVCTPMIINDKFIILYITSLDYEAERRKPGGVARRYFMYEFETGDIYASDYFRLYTTDVSHQQENIIASRLFDISLLKGLYDRLDDEAKAKDKEFGQLIEKLNDDDNPVVRIIFSH